MSLRREGRTMSPRRVASRQFQIVGLPTIKDQLNRLLSGWFVGDTEVRSPVPRQAIAD
jgi:hypothetical protein